jgi:heme/copper-type cytochrome/quinol oxidase subunit 4
MENIKKYLGLALIVIAAIIMLVVMITDNVNNTTLAIAGGLGVVGLLVQVFIGRSIDY